MSNNTFTVRIWAVEMVNIVLKLRLSHTNDSPLNDTLQEALKIKSVENVPQTAVSAVVQHIPGKFLGFPLRWIMSSRQLLVSNRRQVPNPKTIVTDKLAAETMNVPSQCSDTVVDLPRGQSLLISCATSIAKALAGFKRVCTAWISRLVPHSMLPNRKRFRRLPSSPCDLRNLCDTSKDQRGERVFGGQTTITSKDKPKTIPERRPPPLRGLPSTRVVKAFLFTALFAAPTDAAPAIKTTKDNVDCTESISALAGDCHFQDVDLQAQSFRTLVIIILAIKFAVAIVGIPPWLEDLTQTAWAWVHEMTSEQPTPGEVEPADDVADDVDTDIATAGNENPNILDVEPFRLGRPASPRVRGQQDAMLAGEGGQFGGPTARLLEIDILDL